ncbi:hypothetical protein [Escherichia coli]|uniref:hypothetical protein n=1 Tax=Escherichia coli TaxID=562 RepID=UPI00273A0231|nr:hypothetical protein [Escherichia coli]
MSDKVTVKQTINKATSIYKIEQITVGKPGSEQYRHALNHGSLAAANRGVAEYELSE